MSDELGFETTLSREIEAPPERVFDAWLEAETLRRFMCPSEGMRLGAVEVDPRPGGAFLIEMIVGDQVLPHRGEYLVLERPERLSFSWVSKHAGDSSEVSLSFVDLGAGRTRIDLHHRRLPTAPARDNHEAGWSRILELLGGIS